MSEQYIILNLTQTSESFINDIRSLIPISGKSAYQSYIDSGEFVGTEEEWRIWMKGGGVDAPAIAVVIASVPETTPIDSDTLPFYKLIGGVLKKATFANLYAYLKGKLDSVYVAAVDGKGLSTNDFTNALKSAYDGAVIWITTNGTNLLNHIGITNGNPHGVTKSNVGLGSVDNASDSGKPISTAQQTALNLKVDKSIGKGLSTNDYTDTEKTKLSGIATGATAYTDVMALAAAPAETAITIGVLIGGSADATPNDTDFVATSLTASGILKKITWTNVKAFLKTYFDTLYKPVELFYALSDQVTDITTGVRLTDRAPYAFTLDSVRGSLLTAATGAVFTVNIKKNTTTIFSTKLTFDASSTTTVGATTPYVLSVTSFAADDIIEFDVDTVGSVVKGQGLIVKLLGHK